MTKALELHLGSLVLLAKWRQRKLSLKLVQTAIQLFVEHLPAGHEINIAALGFSDAGEALLKRFDFHMYMAADETSHECPVYTMTACQDKLQAEVDKFVGESV